MAAKTSAEMTEALRLVKAGMTAREAARQAGVREESLYRNSSYKELKAGAAGKTKKLSKVLAKKMVLMTQTQLMDAARLKKIFKLRQVEDRSLTQEKLSIQCGWAGQSAAQQYLNGYIPLNLDALIKFAKILNVQITDISPTLSLKIIESIQFLRN